MSLSFRQLSFQLASIVLCSISLFAGDAPAPQKTAATQLSAPERIKVGDEFIDVTVGHAAPFYFDIDNDGLKDLLVGEFGKGTFDSKRLPESMQKKSSSYAEGKLRIYKNYGTAKAPLFKDFTYLKAGDENASIPTT